MWGWGRAWGRAGGFQTDSRVNTKALDRNEPEEFRERGQRKEEVGRVAGTQ
jgi:hypothetical protein